MPLPLGGIKVVELAQMVSAPFGGQILGDLGADVIKIEPPTGDQVRQRPPEKRGLGSFFLATNRNKRSIAINLKDAAGRQLARALVAKADVFLHNMKPGDAERFELGYEELSLLNPRLIYCAVSGYGPKGPYASRPALELALQAFSGFMSVNGESEGPPLRTSASITDLVSGITAAMAIGFALVGRQQTGRGRRVDVSMLESLMSLLNLQVAAYDATGAVPARFGSSHPAEVPYQVFQTADGNITVGAGSDRQFRMLCEALGREDLVADERYRTVGDRVRNRNTLVPELVAIFLRRPTSEWEVILEDAGVIFAVINNVPQCVHHPHSEAIELTGELRHPDGGSYRALRPAIRFDGVKPSRLQTPPGIGEHTAEILAELGLSSARVDELSKAGVVK